MSHESDDMAREIAEILSGLPSDPEYLERAKSEHIELMKGVLSRRAYTLAGVMYIVIKHIYTGDEAFLSEIDSIIEPYRKQIFD
jgi:hypothetical protein